MSAHQCRHNDCLHTKADIMMGHRVRHPYPCQLDRFCIELYHEMTNYVSRQCRGRVHMAIFIMIASAGVGTGTVYVSPDHASVGVAGGIGNFERHGADCHIQGEV
jgi:hypothetical protein